MKKFVNIQSVSSPKGSLAVWMAAFKEKDIFMDTCTILNDTLAWDISGNRDETSCIDIDPETLYELEAIDEMIA